MVIKTYPSGFNSWFYIYLIKDIKDSKGKRDFLFFLLCSWKINYIVLVILLDWIYLQYTLRKGKKPQS